MLLRVGFKVSKAMCSFQCPLLPVWGQRSELSMLPHSPLVTVMDCCPSETIIPKQTLPALVVASYHSKRKVMKTLGHDFKMTKSCFILCGMR